MFQRLPRSFYVNETDPVGSFVFQVSAFVIYSILLFMMNPVIAVKICEIFIQIYDGLNVP